MPAVELAPGHFEYATAPIWADVLVRRRSWVPIPTLGSAARSAGGKGKCGP